MGRTDVRPTRSIAVQVRLARAAIEHLRPSDLADEMAAGPVVLIDVRGAEEWRRCAIDGAINVPRGIVELVVELVADADADGGDRRLLDPAERVVVYSGAGARSALVVQVLYEMGFRDVAHLDGGLAAWMADGRPVVAEW